MLLSFNVFRTELYCSVGGCENINNNNFRDREDNGLQIKGCLQYYNLYNNDFIMGRQCEQYPFSNDEGEYNT